jgi:transcriptional regulator with XRE-family HTH domain
MTSVEIPDRRRAFCARLKAERERRGTTLRTIAERTKVKASLLEELERGNVSHWPKGIYRRSFFRDYVTGIGLPVDPYTSEFAELFPDEDNGPVANEAIAPAPPASGMAALLRLTFADEAQPDATAAWSRLRPRSTFVAMQAVAALLDLAVVFALALPMSAVAAARLDLTAAIVACSYFSLSTLVLGRSPASWWIAGLRRAAASRALAGRVASNGYGRTARTPAPELRSLVGQAFRARSAIREYVGRLSGTTVLAGGSERRRDLASVRRRRTETASRTATDDLAG